MYDQNQGVLRKLKSGEIAASDARPWFLQRTFSRGELLRFVSQSTVSGGLTFPCTTVGGPSAGTPCSFPFVYPDCSEEFKVILFSNDLIDTIHFI